MWCKDICHEVRGRDIDENIDRLYKTIRDVRSADGAVFPDVTTIQEGTMLVPLYRTRQITGIIVPFRRTEYLEVY